MTTRSRFLLWSAVLVVFATMGGTYCANVIALDKTVPTAFEGAIDALFNGVAVPMLYVPAAVIAFLSEAVAKRISAKAALIPFAVGTIPLVVMYAVGHWSAAIALSQQKWTAAGLFVGFLPILGVIWVGLSGLIAALMLKFCVPAVSK